MLSTILLSCCEIGRFPISSLSDQSRIELLGSSFEKLDWCKNEAGDFKDISEIDGVTISSEGHVIVLQLNNMSLRGRLLMHFLPRCLEKVSMWGNQLTGDFVASEIPATSKLAYFGLNSLTGSVELKDLSQAILYLSVFNNNLSGTLDLQQVPVNLIGLEVFQNEFHGSLDLRCIHRRIIYSADGIISGQVWEDAEVMEDAFECDFNHNKFEGEVLVRSLDRIENLYMFWDLAISAVVDDSGNRRLKSEF